MLIEFLYRLGIFNTLVKTFPRRLTVLNYHRIADPYDSQFDTFKPNISATPNEFAKQMDYLLRFFNIVSIHQVNDWLDGKIELPKYPALITFDDGYYDNFANAYPVLKERNIPALIFLTTDFINRVNAPYWDRVARCFYHSPQKRANLPLVGERHWENPKQRDELIKQFTESVKYLPEEEKWEAVNQLSKILAVSADDDFKDLFLSWGQIREMSKAGISFGAHTVSHPILTRVRREIARQEIVKSKVLIEEQLGASVSSFAYPNGQWGDFDEEIEDMVSEADFKTAFSLIDGPSPLRKVKNQPYQIKRIFISHKDDLPRFAAKVSGMQKLR